MYSTGGVRWQLGGGDVCGGAGGCLVSVRGVQLWCDVKEAHARMSGLLLLQLGGRLARSLKQMSDGMAWC